MSLAAIQDILSTWPGWATLELNYGDETSGQGSGVTLIKQLRDPIWSLHAESKPLSAGDIRRWKAKLAGLDNGRKIFYGWDFAATWPSQYPFGAGLPGGVTFGSLSVTVNAIGSDGVSLKLQGLPAGYAGKVGDMISVTYGTTPDLALLHVVEDFVANGSGITGYFEVRAPIPAGMANGDAVKMATPKCTMMIVPGSVSAPKDSSARGVIAFDAIQVPTL